MAYHYYPPVTPTRPPTYSASQSSASLGRDSPLTLTFHRHPQLCEHTLSSSPCPSPTTSDVPVSPKTAVPAPATIEQDVNCMAATRPPTPSMTPCTRQGGARGEYPQISPRPVLAERRRGSLKDTVLERIRCWKREVKGLLLRK